MLATVHSPLPASKGNSTSSRGNSSPEGRLQLRVSRVTSSPRRDALQIEQRRAEMSPCPSGCATSTPKIRVSPSASNALTEASSYYLVNSSVAR
jgi:hypothetical protein